MQQRLPGGIASTTQSRPMTTQGVPIRPLAIPVSGFPLIGSAYRPDILHENGARPSTGSLETDSKRPPSRKNGTAEGLFITSRTAMDSDRKLRPIPLASPAHQRPPSRQQQPPSALHLDDNEDASAASSASLYLTGLGQTAHVIETIVSTRRRVVNGNSARGGEGPRMSGRVRDPALAVEGRVSSRTHHTANQAWAVDPGSGWSDAPLRSTRHSRSEPIGVSPANDEEALHIVDLDDDLDTPVTRFVVPPERPSSRPSSSYMGGSRSARPRMPDHPVPDTPAVALSDLPPAQASSRPSTASRQSRASSRGGAVPALPDLPSGSDGGPSTSCRFQTALDEEFLDLFAN